MLKMITKFFLIYTNLFFILTKKNLEQLIFPWLLILMWTIFVTIVYGYCSGGLFYISDKFVPRSPPILSTSLENKYISCPWFVRLLNLYSFIFVGMVYGMLTKTRKKILISVFICLLQFPTILGISLLLRFIGLQPTEPFMLGITYTLLTVWGFPLGVVIWDKLVRPFFNFLSKRIRHR